MSDEVKSVVELFDSQPKVDKTEVYDRLWKLAGELRAKFDARFTFEIDPSCADLEQYGAGSDGGPAKGPRGSLKTYAGDELDWFVHSWVGDPEESFTNIHVTGWLGNQVKVPHIGFAYGTLPNLWLMIEYMPRTDLSVDLESLDKYFEPLNESYLKLRSDDRFDYFLSGSLYVRQVMSETSFVFLCDETDEMLELISKMSHEALDQWIGWVDEAEPTPDDERAYLAWRDEQIRKNTAERDPANVIAQRFFGEEMADRLIAQLWGAHRELPRPHER